MAHPIVTVRLPQNLLIQISKSLKDSMGGRLQKNPTVSEFIRAAVEEKLARLALSRARRVRGYGKCATCRAKINLSEAAACWQTLFGEIEYECVTCHAKGAN